MPPERAQAGGPRSLFALAIRLGGILLAVSCAASTRAVGDEDAPVVEAQGPAGLFALPWPCAIALPVAPGSAAVREAERGLRAVIEALAEERHADALREARGMREAIEGEVARGFHGPPGSPADEGRDTAARRAVLETWVYGPVPALRVGVDRFWLAPWLSAALATSAVSEGRPEEARFWLVEGGAPSPLDPVLLRCLLWIDLHHEPDRVGEYVDLIDWNAREWTDWRPWVLPHL